MSASLANKQQRIYDTLRRLMNGVCMILHVQDSLGCRRATAEHRDISLPSPPFQVCVCLFVCVCVCVGMIRLSHHRAYV